MAIGIGAMVPSVWVPLSWAIAGDDSPGTNQMPTAAKAAMDTSRFRRTFKIMKVLSCVCAAIGKSGGSFALRSIEATFRRLQHLSRIERPVDDFPASLIFVRGQTER